MIEFLHFNIENVEQKLHYINIKDNIVIIISNFKLDNILNNHITLTLKTIL